MRRLIDANSLKHNMDKYNYSYFGANYEKILEVIDEEPTVDPVKHAHWIEENTVMAKFVKCSNCGIYIRVAREGKENERYYLYSDEMNFCPNCGVRMGEVSENDGL